VLFVVTSSATLVAAAALHFRGLRQVGDIAHARREAMQNARVALERMARQVRAAKAIAAVTAPSDTAGAITITDMSDANHVFEFQAGRIEYGIDKAKDHLATGIAALTFQGYNASGAVPEESPEAMEGVEISLSAAIAGTSDTFDLTTRAHLRRQAPVIAIRHTRSYAAAHTRTLGAIRRPERALGKPTGSLATLGNGDGGRYDGFDRGTETGTVLSMLAGLRMRHSRDDLRVIIRHDTTVLFDTTYTAEDLDPIHWKLRWWWIDLTALRPLWTDADIDRLSIELQDPGPGRTSMRLDSFCILALFDPAEPTIWADAPGGGACPNEWADADNALGAPDDVYAVGGWDGEDYHSFPMPDPGFDGILVALELWIEAYLSSPVDRDDIHVRCAPRTAGKETGSRIELDDEALNGFVGSANEGRIVVGLTHYRDWTRAELRDYEVRLKLDRDDDPLSSREFHVDAVGWRLVFIPTVRGIGSWSEQ
jgi:hypothetical protein